MKRVVIFSALVVGMLLGIRMLVARGGSSIGEQCDAMCDAMLASMPESFPPNRMMADLETLKEQTARILEKLEKPVEEHGPQG